MMEAEKKIANLEQEFKLIKGEVKETLSSLRDYLIRVKLPLPPAEEATVLGGIGNGEKSSLEGTLNVGPGASLAGPAPAATAAPEALAAGTEAVAPAAGANAAAAGGLVEPSRQQPAQDELDMQAAEQQMEYEELGDVGGAGLAESAEGVRVREAPVPAAPQTNLLANLIRWVANAKREIDNEQLITFLEVYGISGGLSPELKEVILHLAEITDEQSADAGKADVWSRLLLELHGILSGGNATAYPIKPFWKDETSEGEPDEAGEVVAGVAAAAGASEDNPLQLKLVFTDGKGKDREFSINLTPETGKDSL